MSSYCKRPSTEITHPKREPSHRLQSGKKTSQMASRRQQWHIRAIATIAITKTEIEKKSGE